MKQLIGIVVIFSAVALFSCKKSKSDCEVNNYGTLKVTYGLSSYRHSVVVTVSGTLQSREKITAIGVTSDTLHLTPGNYLLNISSINSEGAAIDSQNGSSVITQCVESPTSVAF